jgi:hypothetical protein
MTDAVARPAPQRASPREIVVLAGALAALAGAQLLVAGAGSLFTRHFWLDEIFTHTLVADPSLGHSMRALADSVETHPPAFYLLLRGFALVAGTGEAALRSFVFLFTLVALLGAYAALRLSFGRFVSCAAVLALWSHPLVLREAFDARFYAPWLAAAAWFVYFAARSQQPGRPPRAALALTAVLLCTVHYFGVITLALAAGGAALASPLPLRERCRRLLPALAGPAALLCCLPLLVGQRGATTVPTWVPPTDLASVAAFIDGLSPLHITLLLGGAFLAARLRLAAAPPWGPGPAGLLALGLLPLVLIGFSAAVQPVLIARYGMPAAAALAAVTALVGARLPRPVLAGGCAALLALGTWHLHGGARHAAYTDRHTDELAAVLRARTGNDPIAFQHTHELYVVCRYAPDLAGRCVCLDVEPGQVEGVTHFRLFNRDLHRRYVAWYSRPGLIRWDDYRALPRHYLVPAFDQLDGLAGSAARYPGFVAEPVEAELYRLR